MARALIVGCGCRGRALGAALAEQGWAVRGTSRGADGLAPIREAGLEPLDADPLMPGGLLEAVGDVAVMFWLLGTAAGPEDDVAAIHSDRLESLLAKLVDTPLRGFVYEAAGSVAEPTLERGAKLVAEAGETWRIPFELVSVDPADHERWLAAMLAATGAVLRGA